MLAYQAVIQWVKTSCSFTVKAKRYTESLMEKVCVPILQILRSARNKNNLPRTTSDWRPWQIMTDWSRDLLSFQLIVAYLSLTLQNFWISATHNDSKFVESNLRPKSKTMSISPVYLWLPRSVALSAIYQPFNSWLLIFQRLHPVESRTDL